MKDRQTEVLRMLTEEITDTARACAREQHAPSFTPDDMDDYIRGKKETLVALRRIREELENTWSAVLL